MLNDVTVFNIREYLSAKGDNDLGEDELRQILSEFLCDKDLGYIRLLPLSTNDFPSCECAKVFIENGFHRDGELLPGLLDIFLGDYYNKMFILFQY